MWHCWSKMTVQRNKCQSIKLKKNQCFWGDISHSELSGNLWQQWSKVLLKPECILDRKGRNIQSDKVVANCCRPPPSIRAAECGQGPRWLGGSFETSQGISDRPPFHSIHVSLPPPLSSTDSHLSHPFSSVSSLLSLKQDVVHYSGTEECRPR